VKINVNRMVRITKILFHYIMSTLYFLYYTAV